MIIEKHEKIWKLRITRYKFVANFKKQKGGKKMKVLKIIGNVMAWVLVEVVPFADAIVKQVKKWKHEKRMDNEDL